MQGTDGCIGNDLSGVWFSRKVERGPQAHSSARLKFLSLSVSLLSKRNWVFSLFGIVMWKKKYACYSPSGILFVSYQDYISYITVEWETREGKQVTHVVNPYWSNVELKSTSLSVIPCPMPNEARLHFPFYHVQCRVELDITFRCTMSNVELSSTSLSVYHVQGRVELDITFRYTMYNVELSSTSLSVYHVKCRVEVDITFRLLCPMPSSNRHPILQWFMLFLSKGHSI
jgi:hypothetical protein